ncbi:MAG TPA: glutathione S-transferase family protein [Kofleriaceae bacterium]|nr:glutathione S-transferase family protein [Kofleriaceae bacterium]
MITLYHAPNSRASRFVWLLEELGQPYELKQVSIRRREGNSEPDPAYRKIHPHGKVPAIVHDGTIVFESSAIALYLSDAFPEAKLGPKIGDRSRGLYLTLLAYYTGVLEPAFVTKTLGFAATNATTGWAPTDEILAYIGSLLAAGPYILGESFSAADILYGSTFALFKGSPLLPVDPTIAAYTERIESRPAYRRARDKELAAAQRS